MDFSIVIAHRGNPMGLWATIHSCEDDLKHTDFKYEYIVVANGEEKLSTEDENLRHFLDNSGHLGEFIVHPEPLSPPSARQLGADRAAGKLLFFFDNHCLVGRDYFKRAVLDMEHLNMDMLHSTTIFYSGEKIHYHYKLKLASRFWAESVFLPKQALKPYRIAAGGHGGFVVKRDVWNEVGGYWDGFVGYGGEEMYFDLKMALLDKTNWIDPRLIHYHYTGDRGYSRHYSTDFYRNMMMCANIIGGNRWLHGVASNFAKRFTKFGSYDFFDLVMQAEQKSHDHAAYLASIRKRTLEEQLQLFRDLDVAID